MHDNRLPVTLCIVWEFRNLYPLLWCLSVSSSLRCCTHITPRQVLLVVSHQARGRGAAFVSPRGRQAAAGTLSPGSVGFVYSAAAATCLPPRIWIMFLCREVVVLVCSPSFSSLAFFLWVMRRPVDKQRPRVPHPRPQYDPDTLAFPHLLPGVCCVPGYCKCEDSCILLLAIGHDSLVLCSLYYLMACSWNPHVRLYESAVKSRRSSHLGVMNAVFKLGVLVHAFLLFPLHAPDVVCAECNYGQEREKFAC